MIFFGHVGITLGGIHALDRFVFKQKIDLRKVAFLAVAPDLLDKPLGLLNSSFFANHSRLYGHSLIFSIALLYLMQKRWHHPRSYIGLLWFSYFGHMLLDRFWYRSLHYFLWPFLGLPESAPGNIFGRWYNAFFEPYNAFGELAGIAILLFLFFYYGLFSKSRLRNFLRNGSLPAQS